MILERDSLLQSLYKQTLETHNWRVVSSGASAHELFQKYLKLAEKEFYSRDIKLTPIMDCSYCK